MDRRVLVTDPEFERAVVQALTERGEALVVILRTTTGGGREYFLASGAQDWPLIAQRAGGRYGRSDRVDVYLTNELPIRGAPDAENREKAVDLVLATGEVVLARHDPADSELRDVEEAGEVGEVREWFDALDPEASILVGPHPFRHEGAYPFGHPEARRDVLVAYGPNEEGNLVPGAY